MKKRKKKSQVKTYERMGLPVEEIRKELENLKAFLIENKQQDERGADLFLRMDIYDYINAVLHFFNFYEAVDSRMADDDLRIVFNAIFKIAVQAETMVNTIRVKYGHPTSDKVLKSYA